MLKKVLIKHKKNIKGIIQVGANKGQELNILTKFSNNIYLFEPLRSIYIDLVDYCSQFENVKTYNIALGSKNESKTIYVSNTENKESSSLLKPNKHLKYFPEIEFNKNEVVTVKRFDKLNENFVSNFLILDVQGFELEVLKGFGEKLKDIKYIYSEISLTNFYENNVLITELDSYLKLKGFTRVKTSLNSNKPHGDAFYKKLPNVNFLIKFYYMFKSKFQITKIYLFFNFIKDGKKIYFLLKKKLKVKLIT